MCSASLCSRSEPVILASPGLPLSLSGPCGRVSQLFQGPQQVSWPGHDPPLQSTSDQLPDGFPKYGLWSCPFLAPEPPLAPQCWAFGLLLCPQDLLHRSQSSRLPALVSWLKQLLVQRSSCAWFLVLSHQGEYWHVHEVHAKRGQRRPAATGPSPSQMSSLLASLGRGGASEGRRGRAALTSLVTMGPCFTEEGAGRSGPSLRGVVTWPSGWTPWSGQWSSQQALPAWTPAWPNWSWPHVAEHQRHPRA